MDQCSLSLQGLASSQHRNSWIGEQDSSSHDRQFAACWQNESRQYLEAVKRRSIQPDSNRRAKVLRQLHTDGQV